ncbi:MAG TPA: oligosaccharide flippase family protein [Ignavibacteriales bacterium]|nr:oligosaccharide flippase family protein [Ignavibacteriales bacterium]
MSSLAKNFGFSIATFISQIISGSVIYIVLARLLSINDFGLLSFGATLGGLITVIAEFGFSLMAQRDIPQNRFNFESYVYNTVIQKIGFSIVAALGGLIYIFLFYSGQNVTIGIIFVVNAIITSGNMYFFAVFRAKNMFKIESLLALFYSIIIVIIVTIYFIFKQDVVFIAYGLLLVRILQFILLTFIFISKFTLNYKLDRKIQSYLFKNSFSFGAHYIIGVFYFSIDNQMIAYFSGNEQLAIYQAFFKIVLILLMVNNLLEGIFLPFLSSRFKNGINEFTNLAQLINKVIVSLGLTLFVFFILFASDIVKLFYSDKYIAALVITIPLAFVLFTRILSTVYSVILTISDNQNLRVLTVLISLIVNVILNFIFIPKYGFVAAGYVSMITHFVLAGLYVYFGYKQLNSFLLQKKFVGFILISIFSASIFSYLNLHFNFILSVLLLLGWFIVLLLFYNKKELLSIKQLLIEEAF